MSGNGLDHPVRILAGHQAARYMRHGDMRDHGVLATTGDPVNLQCRPLPEALQRAESGFAVRCVQPDAAEVLRLVETDAAISRRRSAVSAGMPA